MATAKKTTSAKKTAKKTTTKKTAKKNLYSPNKKLNAVLKDIHGQLNDFGRDNVEMYMKDPRMHRNEPDYNIAQNGNLLVYYDQVRDMYREAGYSQKTIDKMSNDKIWDTYKRQVGYVARNYPIKKRRD